MRQPPCTNSTRLWPHKTTRTSFFVTSPRQRREKSCIHFRQHYYLRENWFVNCHWNGVLCSARSNASMDAFTTSMRPQTSYIMVLDNGQPPNSGGANEFFITGGLVNQFNGSLIYIIPLFLCCKGCYLREGKFFVSTHKKIQLKQAQDGQWEGFPPLCLKMVGELGKQPHPLNAFLTALFNHSNNFIILTQQLLPF